MTATMIPLKLMNAAMLRVELTAVMAGMRPGEAAPVASAANLADLAHTGQTRRYRDGQARTPYIEHPLRVTLRLARWGFDCPELLVAALLHDVVEDAAPLLAAHFCAREPGHDTGTPWAIAVGTDVLAGSDPITADGLIVELERMSRASEEPQLLEHRVLAWLGHAYGEEVVQAVALVTSTLEPELDYAEKIDAIVAASAPENRTFARTAALLVKASDMCDNAGSLLHQYGHVSDDFVRRLGAKYRRQLPKLVTALNGYHQSETMARAAAHTESIQHKLDELLDGIS